MSTAIAKNFQIGADGTASNNFTLYQPATPDGTLRLGNGNTGITSSLLTLTSAGNLGIGTSSPGNKLSVNSGASGTAASFTSTGTGVYLALANSGATTFIGNDSTSGSFIIQTPASSFSTKLTLDNVGNLGLGVTPSAWSGFKALQTTGGAHFFGNAGAFAQVGANAYWDGSNYIYVTSAQSSRYLQNAGVHSWWSATSGTAGNAISFTQAMTLDASGRLGIGQTSPECALDVLKASSTDDAGRYSIRSFDSTSAASGVGGGIAFTGYFSGTSSAANFATIQGIKENGTAGNFASAMVFTTRANGAGLAERARINSDGNLAIGATSVFDLNTRLELSKGGNCQQFITCTDGVRLYFSASGNTVGAMGTFSNHPLVFRTNDTERARIDSSGNLLVGQTSSVGTRVQIGGYTGSYGSSVGLGVLGNSEFQNGLRIGGLAGTGSRTVTADANGTLSASSDSSLKQEADVRVGGLAELMQVQPKAYKWLSDIEQRGEDAAVEFGFFADQVAPIIPSAAPKGNDGLYGFYDRAMLAVMTKAIQEQQAIINQLKADVAALKGA